MGKVMGKLFNGFPEKTRQGISMLAHANWHHKIRADHPEAEFDYELETRLVENEKERIAGDPAEIEKAMALLRLQQEKQQQQEALQWQQACEERANRTPEEILREERELIQQTRDENVATEMRRRAKQQRAPGSDNSAQRQQEELQRRQRDEQYRVKRGRG